MSAEHPNLRLALSSSAPCLDIVAAALTGVADACSLDALARNDLATVVGELAKNVVLHAYDGAEGPLELELRLREDTVEVTVRDRGIGIRPHLGERTQPHTGIGTPMVHLLSRRVTYTNLPGGGTEVRIEQHIPGLAPLRAAALLDDESASLAEIPREARLSLSPSPLAAHVLARVLCVFGEEPTRDGAIDGLAADLSNEAIVDLALELCLRREHGTLLLDARYFDLGAAERLLARHAGLASGAATLVPSRREGTASLSLSLPCVGAAPAP